MLMCTVDWYCNKTKIIEIDYEHSKTSNEYQCKTEKIKKSARIHKSRRVQIFSEVVLLTYWISVLEEFPKEISITK